MPVEIFGSEFAIQTFHKNVLNQLSGLGKPKTYPQCLTPEEHCLAGKFSAVGRKPALLLIWYAIKICLYLESFTLKLEPAP